jgi:hypothetical protein
VQVVSVGAHDAAGDGLGRVLPPELAHDLEAEVDGGSGTAAGRDEAVDDDGVVVDDGTSSGDGLNEGRVGGGGGGAAGRPSSTPSSAKIEGAAQIAAIASPSSARRSTSAWIAGVAFRFVVPGRPPGRNKTV